MSQDRHVVAFLAIVILYTGCAAAGNWEGWRGDGTGLSGEARLPVTWGHEHNMHWKAALPGRGHSSPIVWGKRVFVTAATPHPQGLASRSVAIGMGLAGCLLGLATAIGLLQRRRPCVVIACGASALVLFLVAGGQFVFVRHAMSGSRWRLVLCLDADTGRVRWQRTVLRTQRLRSHHRNSYATPTPATDGRHVVADFGAGMVCLDIEGRILWRRMNPRYPEHLIFGTGISPVIIGNRVILLYAPEVLSKTRRGDVATRARLSAYDLATGALAWEVVPPGGHDVYNTPVLGQLNGEPVLFMVSWGHLLAYQPDDGRLVQCWDIPVYQCTPSVVWDDRRVYVTSAREYGSAGTVVVKKDTPPRGDDPLCWVSGRAISQIASPLLCDGLLYLATTRGEVFCLDAATGERHWRERPGREYCASVVYGGGNIYVTSSEGETVVLRHGKAYRPLATNSLGEAVFASPAIANGRIYLRGTKHLYCISEPPGTGRN